MDIKYITELLSNDENEFKNHDTWMYNLKDVYDCDILTHHINVRHNSIINNSQFKLKRIFTEIDLLMKTSFLHKNVLFNISSNGSINMYAIFNKPVCFQTDNIPDEILGDFVHRSFFCKTSDDFECFCGRYYDHYLKTNDFIYIRPEIKMLVKITFDNYYPLIMPDFEIFEILRDMRKLKFESLIKQYTPIYLTTYILSTVFKSLHIGWDSLQHNSALKNNNIIDFKIYNDLKNIYNNDIELVLQKFERIITNNNSLKKKVNDDIRLIYGSDSQQFAKYSFYEGI